MSAINLGQAIPLGIVEGATEFLPVSSTAHLRITEALLGIPIDDAQVVGFTAVIQTGAIAAVLVYFAGDIARIARAWFGGLAHRERRNEHDYVASHSFNRFVAYRIGLGTVLIGALSMGYLVG